MSIDAERKDQIEMNYLSSIENIEQEDVNYAHRKGSKKVENLEAKGIPDKLATLWTDIKLMVAMLRDFLFGNYSDVPWKTIAAIAAAIIYFASPIDFIPDFIPVIGYVDDAMVIALAVDLVRDDIETYRRWAKAQ